MGAKPIVLILGFFDGIHRGHRQVVKTAVDYANKKNAKTILLTFKNSPSEFFSKNFDYIFNREHSYQLLKSLGIDEIKDVEFEKLANITAIDYLESLIRTYTPIAIVTGFNYSFGTNRIGTPKMLEVYQQKLNYKYFCVQECVSENKTISSTLIKEFLRNGNIESANKLLESNFIIKSHVIHGEKLGRTIGFPTANLDYPAKIVKIPHGVYIVETLGQKAVLNWGNKPTVDGKKEVLEVHIPNFNENLYGKDLEIQIVKKLRDEKKFDSIEELKIQIKKDVEDCLK